MRSVHTRLCALAPKRMWKCPLDGAPVQANSPNLGKETDFGVNANILQAN